MTDTTMGAEEFVRTISDFRKEAEGGIRDLQASVARLDETMGALSQRMAERAIDGEGNGGSDRELMAFRAYGTEAATGPADHYVRDDGKRTDIRLRGHMADGVYVPGLLDDGQPVSDWHQDFQRAIAERSIVRAALRASGGRNSMRDEVQSPISDRKVAQLMRSAPSELKELRDIGQRIWADSSGIGANFVPDTWIPDFARQLEMMPSTAALFALRDAPASGVLPYVSGRIRPFLHAIPSSDDPSNDPLGSLATAQNTIAPVSMVAGAQIHRDSEEDAIIAVADELAMDLRWSLVAGTDDCIINGDTAGTHQDTIASWVGRWFATSSSTVDHRKGWDGLRKLSTTKSTKADLNTSEDSAAIVTALLNLMDPVHALDQSNTVILVSPEYFLGQMINFAELLTWDKVGGAATILTGGLGGTRGGPLPFQVGYLYGHPVCIAPSLTADLNASGVYDNTTKTKTGILAVDRSRFIRWKRKDAMVEADVNIRNNTRVVVARKRDVFKERLTATVEDNVAYGYNLAPA